MRVDPLSFTLNLEALRLMAEVAHKGCIFYATDPFYQAVLARFVFS